MKNKTAQYTELDRLLRKKELQKSDYWGGSGSAEQKILPFIPVERDPKTKVDKNEQKRRELHTEIQKAHEHEKDELYTPQEAYRLQYPELTPEQIRYTPLTEEERNNYRRQDWAEQHKLQKYKETGQWEKDKDTPYYYYWNKPDPREVERIEQGISKHKDLYERNKLTPEEAKAQVLEEYKKLVKISKDFDLYYVEANELASSMPELDFSKSYLYLFQNFPQYIVGVVASEIGSLFGSAKYYARHGWSAPAHFDHWEKELTNLMHQMNVFNITPTNINFVKSQIRHMIEYMQNIINEYLKRKKILKKLPKILEEANNSLLENNNFKTFLLWMDKYFPDEKETFIGEIIKTLLSREKYKTNEEQRLLSISDLEIVKTYQKIYDKAKQSAHTKLVEKLHQNAQLKLETFLIEQIHQIMGKEIAKLKEIADDLYDMNEEVATVNKDKFRVFVKYVNKEYNLNISHILQVVNNVIDSRGTIHVKHNTEKSPEKLKSDYIMYFILFMKEFTKEYSDLSVYKAKQHVQNLAQNFINLFRGKGDFIEVNSLEQATEQHLQNYIKSDIQRLIIDCLPRFSNRTLFYMPYDDEKRVESKFPDLTSLGELIKGVGTYSMQGFADYVMKFMPGIPPDFASHLVKQAFRNFTNLKLGVHYDKSVLKKILELRNRDSANAAAIFIELLKRNDKFNRDSFTAMFLEHFSKLVSSFSQTRMDLSSKIDTKTIEQIFTQSLSTFENLQRDLSNIRDMVEFLHNSASQLSDKDLLKLVNNPNFRQFHKLDVSKKLLKAYAKIKNLGGPEGIKQKYDKLIEHLKKEKHISRNFWSNIKVITQVFNFNKLIVPGSPLFDKVVKAAITVESDLETLQDSQALFGLIQKAQPKDKRLFKLDWAINPDLRFRVLRDKDPRHLRVGIETQCCQRLGGAAENVVKDSFINPIAGVIILERRHEGQWQLLAQSYFNYVPDENGYILDNVETNEKVVAQSGLHLEGLYAALARHMKEKYNVKYFLAGKRYSEIDNDIFKDHSLPGDPRTFAYPVGHQTDFSAKDHTNLLQPKFALQAVFTDYKKHFKDPEFEEKKKALDTQINDYLVALAF